MCGSGDYDRKKKKDTVDCLMGCAVVLFFVVAGNFDYDWKKNLDRYLIGVLECHQLTPPNKIVLFLAKHLPPIYDSRHYLHCTISLIMKKNSEPTSSNLHLTRNEK